MFAVHLGNPFTAAERRRKLDEDILNSHRDRERLRRAETLILPSTLSSRPPELSPLGTEETQDSSVTISGSASIQNESSDTNQMEIPSTGPKPETIAENVASIPKNTTPSAATTEIDDLILQWTNIDKDSLNELNKEAGIGGEEDNLLEIETKLGHRLFVTDPDVSALTDYRPKSAIPCIVNDKI
jgi:hypothetical protein